MATKEITTNEQAVQEFKTFWQQIDKPNGSVYTEDDDVFINDLRNNFHEVHNAELNTEERKYFSSASGRQVIMGYALSVRDLLEMIGLDYDVYEANKKQIHGYESKGIQICFGHNHKHEGQTKIINNDRLELIMRPLLFESNDKPMAAIADVTYYCTTYSGNPNSNPCPPPLDHCPQA